MVVAALTTLSFTDPLVTLNGVTASLADGSTVQFFSVGTATITGNFTAPIAQYDVVNAAQEGGFALTNALDIAVNSDTQATLTAATKVLDPSTTGLRELAAGTIVNVPAQSVVQFPSGVGDPDRGERRGSLVVQPARGVHHAGGHGAAGASACPNPQPSTTSSSRSR